MATNAILPALYDLAADYAEGVAKSNNLDMPVSWRSNLSQCSHKRIIPDSTPTTQRIEKLLRDIDNEKARIQKARTKRVKLQHPHPIHRNPKPVSALISATKALNNVAEAETKLATAITHPIPPVSMTKKLESELTQQTGRARAPRGKRNPKGKQPKRQRVQVVVPRMAPANLTGEFDFPVPLINGKRSCILRATERLTSIAGTSSGSTTTSWVNTNPGSATFPWLSSIALSFSRYRWRKLRIRFVSSMQSGIPGKVAITTCYNPNFNGSGNTTNSLNNALNNLNSKEFKVWENAATKNLVLPDWKKDSPKYVQTNGVTASALSGAANWGDWSYMTLAFWQTGTNTTLILGDFWADYEIELIDPTPASGVAGGASSSASTNATTLDPTGTSGTGYQIEESALVSAVQSPVKHIIPTAAQLFFCDGGKMYFQKDFEGLLLYQLVSGALTGEASTAQLTLTSDDPNFEQTLITSTVGTDKKRELHVIKITAGSYLNIALSGGLSIDTTAKCLIRVCNGGYGAYAVLSAVIDS